MKPQAVRRSARWLAMRAWYRRQDLATQADLALGAFVLAGWGLLSLFGPELFR